ncbi:MAG TPA: serine--tRNA ligase, partial [Spirochaetia bacterium]|nr:serine--tRNA ligase [Spirochaetia bacterium]
MLSAQFIREQEKLVRDCLKKRGSAFALDDFLKLDDERRKIKTETETRKAERNTVSRKIGELTKEKKDISALREQMKKNGEEIQALEQKLAEKELLFEKQILEIPNILADDVPEGRTELDNREIRREGKIPQFDFTPKSHADLGAGLDIIDSPRAVKISGSRFAVLKAAGARLERALMNFMLDMHTAKGYTEVSP